MIDSKLTVSKGLRCLKKVHMLDLKVIGEKKLSLMIYNLGHNILRLFDVLPNFLD